MALSESVLSGLMVTNIKAIPGISISDDEELEKFTDAIAKAVVDHIKAAAVVTPGSFVAPPGAGGGPVTGSGAIT